jgi:hypothetical protein
VPTAFRATQEHSRISKMSPEQDQGNVHWITLGDPYWWRLEHARRLGMQEVGGSILFSTATPRSVERNRSRSRRTVQQQPGQHAYRCPWARVMTSRRRNDDCTALLLLRRCLAGADHRRVGRRQLTGVHERAPGLRTLRLHQRSAGVPAIGLHDESGDLTVECKRQQPPEEWREYEPEDERDRRGGRNPLGVPSRRGIFRTIAAVHHQRDHAVVISLKRCFPSGDPPPVMLRRSIIWRRLPYAMIRILSTPRLVHRRLVPQL